MANEMWTDGFTSIDSALDVEFFACTDDNGYCHVIEFSDVDFKVTHYQNSSGSMVGEVIDTFTDQGNYNCGGFLDSAGKLHFVVVTNSSTEVWYMTNATGSWVSTKIHQQVVAETFSFPVVTADGSSKAHVIFNEDAATIEYMTNATGSWVGPTNICTIGTGVGEMVAVRSTSTGFAVNSDSTDLMITGRGSGTNMESLRYTAGSWGSTVTATALYRSQAGACCPCINTGASTYTVFYVSSSPAADTGMLTYSSSSWSAQTIISSSHSGPYGFHRGAAARQDSTGRYWITAQASNIELLVSDDGSTWYRHDTGEASISLNTYVGGSYTADPFKCDIVKYASSTLQHSQAAIPGVVKYGSYQTATAASHTVSDPVSGGGTSNVILVMGWATGASSINDLSISADVKAELIAGTEYENAAVGQVKIQLWRFTESVGFGEVTFTYADSEANATKTGIATMQYTANFEEGFIFKAIDSSNATSAASSGNVSTAQSISLQFNLLVGLYEDGVSTTTFDTANVTDDWYVTNCDGGSTEGEINSGENRFALLHNFETGAKTEDIDIAGAVSKDNVIAVMYTLQQNDLPVAASFVPQQINY